MCDRRGHQRERLPQRAGADRDDDVMIAVQRACLSQRYLLRASVLGAVYGHQHASSPMRHDVGFQPRVTVTFRVRDCSGAEYEGVRVHDSHGPESRRRTVSPKAG